MKDEFKGKMISEFVGLSLKMYSLVDVDGEENKKVKGIKKNVAKNTRHKEFVDVLFNKKIGNTQHEKNSKCIEVELIIFAKFFCLVSMIKDTY